MDVVELRNVFLYNTFRFIFSSNHTVLSTFIKNAIKSSVIGSIVLILNLNCFPKVWFLDKKKLDNGFIMDLMNRSIRKRTFKHLASKL